MGDDQPAEMDTPDTGQLEVAVEDHWRPLDWLLDDEASISDDWKRPAEVVAFPNAASKPTTLSLEAAQLIDQLSQSEQVELLHYLRVRIQTMGHKPLPGQ